jgi:hypothetical protein
MTTNEKITKKGQFEPHEIQTIRELVDPHNPTSGIKAAADRLGREVASVQTKYYKDIRKGKTTPDNGSVEQRKVNNNYPIARNGNENKTGESLPLQGIKALIPKLTNQTERVKAIEALVSEAV